LCVESVVSLQPIPHLLLHSELGNRRLPLTGTSCWTIGRGDDNSFVISDRWISRNHAMLQWMETGEFYLIDLGSRNGTFVNGRRVSIPVTLQSGDRLTFGQTELDFFCPLHSSSEDITSDLDSAESTSTAVLHVRRLISILVIDIRDFTVLTRQLDEKLLSEVIGTWFRRAGEIIREYGSWVDKYIGDAVMAVWTHGPQGVNREEVIQICKALDALQKMTSSLYQQYPLPFPIEIGAGVNTGFAMVGNTGSGDRPDYTALGDTVNAAFRLESATKQIGLDIALGETTYQYLASLIPNVNFFESHHVDLKGYDSPTPAHACTFVDLDHFLQATLTPNP
jgi:adenylate cyclase